MNFKYPITTLSGVEEANPDSTDVILTPGVVEQVSVTFPAGCAGLVGLRVLRGLFQVWPLTSGEWFISDNFTVVLPCHHKVEEGADRFRVETYNTDTENPHTLHVAFSVLLPDTVSIQILDVLNERLPAGLDGLVPAVTAIQSTAGQSIEIMQEELIPILQASLQAQRKLLERSYADMSTEELLQW